MIIHWHKKAEASLHRVEKYVLSKFGENERQKFMDEIDRSILALTDLPTLGKIDPLFAHRKQIYRSIIIRRFNKVVYYIKNETINIVAFWDTRREPNNQASQVKEQ